MSLVGSHVQWACSQTLLYDLTMLKLSGSWNLSANDSPSFIPFSKDDSHLRAIRGLVHKKLTGNQVRLPLPGALHNAGQVNVVETKWRSQDETFIGAIILFWQTLNPRHWHIPQIWRESFVHSCEGVHWSQRAQLRRLRLVCPVISQCRRTLHTTSRPSLLATRVFHDEIASNQLPWSSSICSLTCSRILQYARSYGIYWNRRDVPKSWSGWSVDNLRKISDK